MDKRGLKKTLKGTVISNKMRNTVVVKVTRKKRHPKYQKLVEFCKKYYVHSEKDLQVGQEVEIIACRPMSKLKRFRIIGN